MQLQFPKRIPIAWAFLFASITFVVQQIQGTDVAFSGYYFFYVMLTTVAFNLAGGFERIAGAYIFLFSVLVCIFGVSWKMVVAEPANSNLVAADTTMLAYAGSAAMLLAVALALNYVDLRKYEFGAGGTSKDLNFTAAGLGCVVIALSVNIAQAFGMIPGGVINIVNQLNFFMPLGIMLSTIGAIDESQGRRTFNTASIVGIGITTLVGIAAFSKQGMIVPFACWLIGVAYRRLRISNRMFVTIVAWGALCIFVFSPLSAARDKNYGSTGYLQSFEIALDLMIHLPTLRAHVEEIQGSDIGNGGYYEHAQNPLITRMNMIGPDDLFVNYATTHEPLGFDPLIDDLLNLVPHFLAPNKKDPLSGNHYAHLIGMGLAGDDDSTGISFSPVPEALMFFGWWGIFALLPITWFVLFASIEFIAGDFRTSPWTLLMIFLFAHSAPESLYGGLIYFIGVGNEAQLLAIVFCTRITPVLGALFTGSSAPVVIHMARTAPKAGPGPPAGMQTTPALP